MGVLETKRVIQQPKRRRMNKKLRTLQLVLRVSVLVAGIVALGAIIYSVGFARYTNINLSELTTAELSGYDGHGTVRTSTLVMPGYEQFFDTVNVDITTPEESSNGELSNGDKVELEYTYDKKLARSLGLKVKAHEEVVTIKDLASATVVSNDDIFAGITIKMEGVAPLVTAEMENNTTDPVISTAEFEIVDPKEYYSNGDVVTVKATIDPDIFAANAYEVTGGGSSFTKDYPVNVPERYIEDASEITPELLADMIEHGSTLFGRESGDANEFGLRVFSDAGKMYTTEGSQYTFRFTGTSFISAYFTRVEPDHIGEPGTHFNDIKVVYDTGISQSDGQSVAAEAVVIYRNIIEREDGSISVDMDDAEIISVSRRDEQIKNLVRSTDDDTYTSVKLEQ